jgi:tight adherence protein C
LKFLVCLVFLILSSISFAQVRCVDNFNAISLDCLEFNQSKFNDQPILVGPDIENRVYFYKTHLGNLGKFKVVSVVTDKTITATVNNPKPQKECTVYIEASTFIKGRTFTPNSILTIKEEFDVWQKDRLSLDKGGPNDLSLIRADGKCYIKPISSSIYFYKKIEDGEYLKTGSDILQYSALFLIALAVFLIAKSVLSDEDKFKAQEKLEEAGEDGEKKNAPPTDFVLKYSRPFFKRYFSPIVNGMKNKQKFKTAYKRKLANAGLTKELTPEDFFAFKIFLIIGFPIVFIILRIILDETWPLTAIPVLGGLGFMYPNIWLNGKIEKRKEEILRGMPFIVDMLALSIEAGLDFMAAMQKVIEKAPRSALVEEFETLIKETKIGSSRAEGLRQLSYRADVLPVNSFCATLIAADSVGASIGPILKQLSGELRVKKSADAEKKGATAATKILFPMILFIMPAIFIAIAGPMLLKFISGGS